MFRGGHEKIVSDRRTSTNCWCQKECKEDPLVDNVCIMILFKEIQIFFFVTEKIILIFLIY